MQWSDETVERVELELRDKHPVPMGFEDSRWLAKAALAAVAECKEVRELVYSAKKAIASLSYAEMQCLPEGRIITLNKAALQTSLTPFVEGE